MLSVVRRALFVFVAFVVASSASCSTVKKDVVTVGSDGATILIDCTEKAVAAQVPAVVGEINQILVDSARSVDAKQVAIDNLEVASVSVLACAAREAFADLTRSHLFDSANPEIVANRSTIKGYLDAKSFQFSDGFTASGSDGGAN